MLAALGFNGRTAARFLKHLYNWTIAIHLWHIWALFLSYSSWEGASQLPCKPHHIHTFKFLQFSTKSYFFLLLTAKALSLTRAWTWTCFRNSRLPQLSEWLRRDFSPLLQASRWISDVLRCQQLGTEVLVWWQVPHMAAGVGAALSPSSISAASLLRHCNLDSKWTSPLLWHYSPKSNVHRDNSKKLQGNGIVPNTTLYHPSYPQSLACVVHTAAWYMHCVLGEWQGVFVP